MKLDQRFVRFLLIQIILASSISYMATTGLKFVFAEPRPCELVDACQDSYSFPSRHAGIAFAAGTIISIYISRWSVRILFFALASLVGYWRIAIGFHTLNDVLGGLVVGVIVAVGVYYFEKRFHGFKYRQNQSSY